MKTEYFLLSALRRRTITLLLLFMSIPVIVIEKPSVKSCTNFTSLVSGKQE